MKTNEFLFKLNWKCANKLRLWTVRTVDRTACCRLATQFNDNGRYLYFTVGDGCCSTKGRRCSTCQGPVDPVSTSLIDIICSLQDQTELRAAQNDSPALNME